MRSDVIVEQTDCLFQRAHIAESLLKADTRGMFALAEARIWLIDCYLKVRGFN